MKGGKQPGAGRPKGPPQYPTSIRLTAEQRAKYIDLGGARWVKRLIEQAINNKGKSWN